MTLDLQSLHCEWLVYSVKRTHNSRELVAHLRRDGGTTPDLKLLIADLLEGKVKATPKRKTFKDVYGSKMGRAVLKAELVAVRNLLTKDSIEDWEMNEAWLKRAGYNEKHAPESKREITKAAKLIVARQHGMTRAQLDEFLSPRTARKKTL